MEIEKLLSPAPETSTIYDIRKLEHQYMKLLETRIADLESQLSPIRRRKGSTWSSKITSNETEVGFLSKAYNQARDIYPRLKAEGPDTPEDSDSETKPCAGIDGVREEDVGDKQKKDASEAPKDKDTTEKAEEDPKDSKNSRYRVVISRWNENTLTRDDTPADIKDEKPKPSDRAFTFRKIQLTGDKKPTSSEAVIESHQLQKLLGKITKEYARDDVVTEMQSPFVELVWKWEEAQAEADTTGEPETEEEKQARRDLKELLKIIFRSSGLEELDKYFKEMSRLTRDKSITHEALWTIFPTGELVLGRPFLNEPQLFFVAGSDGFPREPRDAFRLQCYGYDWNGTHFNRVPFETTIEHFDEKRIISELQYYPLRYYQEEGKSAEESINSLIKKLTERGQRYREICISERGHQMFRYDGIALHQKNSGIFYSRPSTSSEDDSYSRMSHSVITEMSKKIPGSGKVAVRGIAMVDFASYFEYTSPSAPLMGNLQRYEEEMECTCPECRSKDSYRRLYRFDWDKHGPDTDMSNEQYQLCPPRVLGYVMEQKKWMQLHVDKVETPKRANKTTFDDKLQLDEGYKELISKSVRAHEAGKKRDDRGRTRGIEDFAEGKGKGLTILLYGLPGVGKTLTAESVAQIAGKPLFSVGVADLGIEGQNIEANLQKIFDLAGLWEAVLLFDEADVFLEARGSGENDLRRNAMVSVLLRVLEYYEGILILTTNRMESFDIAVQSRIHLAIKYEDLTKEQRQNIFFSFLEQLREKKSNFNGRQIRNIVSTAMGLANADGMRLTKNHLIDVAKQTEDFQKDLAIQDAVYRNEHIKKK